MSFADLKRSSSSSFEKLNKELSKLNSSNERKNDDENYWKPEVDKAGNGYAVLRFLPAPENEDFPFVRIFDHGFQGPTGLWYIEKSLTTLGQNDPVGEYNSKLWNSGIDADKEIARKQKRRLSYISNVLVVKDPSNPANEGKVFLYKYGKKIFDKLNDLMNPQFEDEDPVNPFDLWKGANFKLKIRQVEGYRNYDKSEFDTPAPLFDDDDKLEATWKKEFSLQDLVDPKHFKSYSELKTRLDTVLSPTGSALRPAARADTAPPWNEDKAPAMAAPSPKAAEAKAPAMVDDDDEDLEFFKRLADED
jgi:hypothetical protein